MQTLLQQEFRSRYNHDFDRLFFAPARVNLIGEHIDYNGGLVMPCAITHGTYLAIKRTEEPVLKFSSLNFPEDTFEIPIQNSYTKNKDYWVNYPLGVVDYFTQKGLEPGGMEFLFYGNIPNGAGLSSSASIEVVTAYAIKTLYNVSYGTTQIALLSQEVENNFVGVNCGIMDQFSIAMGKANHALVLDCETLEFNYIPFQLKDHTLLVLNTNKQRTLAASKYNERRATCEAALKIFNQKGSFSSLCTIPEDFFENHKEMLTPEMQQRVKHVIYENQRVHQSAQALKQNNIIEFGQLMNASHESLMNDYEVTGLELDTIYLESIAFSGVVGCRMTGAGFGGCAIALVENNRVEDYKTHISNQYFNKIGYAPTIYEVSIGGGVQEIIL